MSDKCSDFACGFVAAGARIPRVYSAGGRTSTTQPLTVTRVANACVLLEIGDAVILTDPWFTRARALIEQPAIAVDALPRLSAIVGSHDAKDHWNIDALSGYPFRESTPVFVATRQMANRARKAGFHLVKQVAWRTAKRLTSLVSMQVLQAQRSPLGRRTNNYIFETAGLRVFFGGETRELPPLRTYRVNHPGVDVYIGPVNGLRFAGFQLVTTAEEAVAAARILGAHVMIPIHYAHRSRRMLGGPMSTFEDVERAARGSDTPRVVRVQAGQRWTLTDGAA